MIVSHGKREMKQERSGGRVFLRVLLILTLLAAGAWGAWKLLVKEPEPAVPAMASLGEASEASGAEAARGRKKRCYTFLLVGMDKVGSNTDSLIIVRYDVDNQDVSMASIPRDTGVNVKRRLKKINAAYANGGMEQLIDEVERTFGIPMDFYIKVKVNGFVALVDELGGIDFDVPCNMNYDDPAQDLHIHYNAGRQHLSGQQALEVCRFRHNNDNSGYTDTGRMETQRGVLTAIAKKLLSWSSLTKLKSFIDIATEHVDTNLSASDMAWFAQKALSFDMNEEKLHTMMLPAEWHNPYMYLDPDETLKMVNDYLNPYVEARTADQLDILKR